MRPPIVFAASALASLAPLAAASQTVPAQMKDATVVVKVVAVDRSLGNQEVVAQGSGFYISRLGHLVTAAHLVSDLGQGVIPETVRYYVAWDNTTSAPKIPVSHVVTLNDDDLMILQVPLADEKRPVTTVRRSVVVDDITPLTTAVFTGGFPQGGDYTPDVATVKTFTGGVDPPLNTWVTSFAFKIGQSGSPVWLADGTVVGVVRASDAKAPTWGHITPSVLIPDKFIEKPSAPALYPKPKTRVRIWAVVDVAHQQRDAAVLQISQTAHPCEPPDPIRLKPPQPGGEVRIETVQIALDPRSQPVQAELKPDGVYVRPGLPPCPGFPQRLFVKALPVSATIRFEAARQVIVPTRVMIIELSLSGAGDPDRLQGPAGDPNRYDIEVIYPDDRTQKVDPDGVVKAGGAIDVVEIKARLTP